MSKFYKCINAGPIKYGDPNLNLTEGKIYKEVVGRDEINFVSSNKRVIVIDDCNQERKCWVERFVKIEEERVKLEEIIISLRKEIDNV